MFEGSAIKHPQVLINVMSLKGLAEIIRWDELRDAERNAQRPNVKTE